jgi:hypothetical protein
MASDKSLTALGRTGPPPVPTASSQSETFPARPVELPPIRRSPPCPRPPADSSAPTESVARLHGAGYTGENVTVGVLDVTGFDTGHPTLAGRVAGTHAFAEGETVANAGRHDHGTAAASVVARTAPDADLYLASFDTADGFRQGVAWLLGPPVSAGPVLYAGCRRPGATGVEGSAVACWSRLRRARL